MCIHKRSAWVVVTNGGIFSTMTGGDNFMFTRDTILWNKTHPCIELTTQEMVISEQGWQHWRMVVMYCIILQHETTGRKWVNYTSLCITSYNYMQTYECVQIQCCFKKYRGPCLLWDTFTFFFIVVWWGPFPDATFWICTVTYFYALVSPYPILLPPGNLIFWDIFFWCLFIFFK